MLVYVLIAGYALLASAASKLAPGDKLCEQQLLRAVAPWSSGCFYTAYFQDDPSLEQLAEEKVRLDRFAENNGFASDVLWYRSVFHQKYQQQFRTSFEDIHKMQLRYTQAQHRRLDLQIQYLEFLRQSELLPLAQSTLDRFCQIYVPGKRPDFTDELEWRLRDAKLPLSLAVCQSKIDAVRR